MSKHERDQDKTTGFSPPLKSAKNDHGDAPRGPSDAGRICDFTPASAAVLAKRKILKVSKPQANHAAASTPSAAIPDAGLFSAEGKRDEKKLIDSIEREIDGIGTNDGTLGLKFHSLVKYRKQPVVGTPIPQTEMHKHRGAGTITFTKDGVVTAHANGTRQTVLASRLPSCDGYPWGAIIGKPERKTTRPTLLIMARDHALVKEGETRAFYLVLEDHNDLLAVINFVLTYYKENTSSASECSSLDSDEDTSDDLNHSFVSVDTEMSLLEESQDIFHANNLLGLSATKKESPV